MEKKKESTNLIITELFLVKADWTRTFLGEIRREVTKEGKPVVYGKVVVNEGVCYSSGDSQEELAQNMNDICILKLDYELHSDKGVAITIIEAKFFLN